VPHRQSIERADSVRYRPWWNAPTRSGGT